jgi:hypothetical protein
MIEKINNSQIQGFLDKPLKQTDVVKQAPKNSADAFLQADYASLINEAMQTQESDASAVQKAKELLLSGQLDNPENIRQAAENIIKFGL